MKVLFLTADLGGNVPPTMAIALELCRRGIRVEVAGILVGTGPGAAASEDTIDDAAVPTEMDASWGQQRDATGAPQPLGPGALRIFFSRSLAREAETLIRDRRPDVVVVDCMALALIKGANRSGLPAVVLLHTFGAAGAGSPRSNPPVVTIASTGRSPSASMTLRYARRIPGREVVENDTTTRGGIVVEPPSDSAALTSVVPVHT